MTFPDQPTDQPADQPPDRATSAEATREARGEATGEASDEASDEAGRTPPQTGRRMVLAGAAGAALGGAAVGGAGLVYAKSRSSTPWGSGTSVSLTMAPPLQYFRSTRLFAPKVSVWAKEGATSSQGLTFTAPRIPTFRGIAWDLEGSPVWIEPDGLDITDLRVQTYRGKPVITFWTGLVLDGTGNGLGVVLDETYSRIAEVRMGSGMLADMHEFRITERDTALFTSFPVYPRDLRDFGGPQDGYVWGARVQEVDIATGELIFDWEGLDHIDLEESLHAVDEKGATPERPWDPVHANSVEADGEHHLLVSARHTSALYKIDKRTGEIVWRMGGKRSDFKVPQPARFHWQHDLRRQPDGTLTLYDNHARALETDAVSAALTLRVDEKRKRVTLVRAYRHADRYGYAMGNAHYLEDGHVFVGWGTSPYVTEFDPDGEAIWELKGMGLGSYRAYRNAWVGRPTTDPEVTVDDATAYVSWNGATEVARWRLLGGDASDDLAEVTTLDRDGFETALETGGAAYVQVEALDDAGSVLGRTRVVAGDGSVGVVPRRGGSEG